METQSGIEMVAIADLVPYANNARTHSKAQVEQIAASIREFGWTNPVLIKDDLTIIAGHGRVIAAKSMGQNSVPCIRLSHLTDAQVQAYVIADNKLATNAGWDEEILAAELQALADQGFQIDVLGFSDRELNELLTDNKEGLTDPDEIPEVPPEPISTIGDVWVLGKHRIICGDCTDKTAVDHLLAGVVPHLMVTDPPYGVSYDPVWREVAGINPVGGSSIGNVLNDDRSDWTKAWNLFQGDVAYVWHGGLHGGTVETSLRAAGFVCRAQIIWVKQQIVFGRGDYHWQHEPCWYAVRKNKAGGYVGDRKQATIWEISNNNSANKSAEETFGHGTQKPVECMKRPILNNSSPGQAVYEPFSGSGTTIIASEITGRCCYAVELNPAYVDMAALRWQKFTGEVAVNERTGLQFTQAETVKE